MRRYGRSRDARRAFAVGLVLAVVTHCAAHAYTWSGTARQCVAEIAQHADCGSCSAMWADVSRCVIGRSMPNVSPAIAEQCIADVNEREWSAPMAKDRVADVIACVLH